MSQKYNYCCLDCTCGAKGSDKDFVIEGVEDINEQEKEIEFCPNTEEPHPLKLLGMSVSGGYVKFNTLSKEDKRKMLKARSHEHFNKEIKEQKHEKWKQLMKEVKGK